MELTPANSPKYSMEDILEQNREWRNSIRKDAKEMNREELMFALMQTELAMQSANSLPVYLREAERLSILEKVLHSKKVE